ncbi:restriction endonuclease [Candidatus Magnetoovum chiemensis]|nr:restriction endonuclease [Candidatus Magnetoovum chiemensis]
MKTQEIETLGKDFDLTEIINGEEIAAPSPFSRHQYIISNLYDIISPYVRKNKLGKALFSPLDVIFEENINRLQPDLLFIKNENMSIIQDWIRGAPDMVCEVASKGSLAKDSVTKMNIYEHYQVPEYWIVIPELLEVKILTLENDRYKLHSSAKGNGLVKSKIIEDLQFDINDIFS